MPDTPTDRLVHAVAGVVARVLWAIADDLDRLERVIDRIKSRVNNGGHRTLDAAIHYSEERQA